MKQRKSKRMLAILLPLLAISLSSCDIFDLLGRGFRYVIKPACFVFFPF